MYVRHYTDIMTFGIMKTNFNNNRLQKKSKKQKRFIQRYDHICLKRKGTELKSANYKPKKKSAFENRQNPSGHLGQVKMTF